MNLSLEVPEFNPRIGIKYKWEENFEIKTQIQSNEIVILANKAGLLSLANHLLNLAQDKIPVGHHLHFDESNSLEIGSLGLIIQKT